MAKIDEWDKEQQKNWDDWVSVRPVIIQEMCKKYPPNTLHLLKTSNQTSYFSVSLWFFQCIFW